MVRGLHSLVLAPLVTVKAHHLFDEPARCQFIASGCVLSVSVRRTCLQGVWILLLPLVDAVRAAREAIYSRESLCSCMAFCSRALLRGEPMSDFSSWNTIMPKSKCSRRPTSGVFPHEEAKPHCA